MKAFSLVIVLGVFLQWSSAYSSVKGAVKGLSSSSSHTPSPLPSSAINTDCVKTVPGDTYTKKWQEKVDEFLKKYIVQNQLTLNQAENDILRNDQLLKILCNDFSATECDLKQFLIEDFEKLNEENYFLTEWQQNLVNKLLVVVNQGQVTVEDLKLIAEINVYQWATNYNVEVFAVHKFLEKEINILQQNGLIRHAEVNILEEEIRKEILVLTQNNNFELYELQKELLSSQQKLKTWAHSLNIQVRELQIEIKAFCQRIQNLNVQIHEQDSEFVKKQNLIRQYNENVEKYTKDFLNENLPTEYNGIPTVTLNKFSDEYSHVFHLLEKLYSQIDNKINNLTHSQATVVEKKEYLRERTYELEKLKKNKHADDLHFAQQFYQEKLNYTISEVHDLEVLLSQVSETNIDLNETKKYVHYKIEHIKEFVNYIKKLIDLRENYKSLINTTSKNFIKIGQNTLNDNDLAELYKLSIDDLEVQLKKYQKHHYEYVLQSEWQKHAKVLLAEQEERAQIERKLSAELNFVLNDTRNDLKEISTQTIAIFEITIERIHTVLNDLTSKFEDKTLEFTSIIDLLETERARLNDICINIDLANIDIEKQLVFDSQYLQSLSLIHHISYETLVKWERQVLNETLKTKIKKLVVKQKTENKRHIDELVELYATIYAYFKQIYKTEDVPKTLDINDHVVNDIQEKFEGQVIEVYNSKTDIGKHYEQLQQGIFNLKHKVEHINSEHEASYKSLIEKNVEKHDLEFIKSVYQSEWNTKLSEIQHALQEIELNFDKQSKFSTTEVNALDQEILQYEKLLKELIKVQKQLSYLRQLHNEKVSDIDQINIKIENIYLTEVPKVRQLEKLLNNIVHEQDLDYLSIYELKEALKALEKYQDEYETYIKDISDINNKLKPLLEERNAKYSEIYNIIDSVKNYNILKKKYLEDLDHLSYNLQEKLKQNTNYNKSIVTLIIESLSEFNIKVQQLEVFQKQSSEVTQFFESEQTRLKNICKDIDITSFNIDQQLTSDSQHLQNLSATYHISYEVLVKWERQILEETLKPAIKKIVIQQKAENEKNIYEIIYLYETLNATLEKQYKTKDVPKILDINEYDVNDIQEKFENHVLEAYNSKTEISKYREELEQGIDKLKYKVEQFNSKIEAFYKSLIEKNIEKLDLEFIKTVYQREWDTELSKIQHALQELELNLEQVNKQSKLSNTLDKEISENEKTLKELIKVQNKLSHLRQLYNEKVSEVEQINTKIENIYLNAVPKVRELEKLTKNILHEQDLDYLSIYELKEALKTLENYQDESEIYIKDISDINNKLKQLLEERNAKYSEIYNINDSIKNCNLIKKKYLEDLDHIIYNLHEQLKENANNKENIVTLINESLSEYKIKMQQLEVFYKPSIEVIKFFKPERTRLKNICKNIDITSFNIDQQLTSDSQHLQNLSATYHISYEVLVKWERQVLEETLKTIIKKIVIQQKNENEKHIYEIIHLYETLNATLEEQYKTKDVQQTLDINEHDVNDNQEKFESLVLEAHNSKTEISKYREELEQGIDNLKLKIEQFNSKIEAFYKSLNKKNIDKLDLEFIKSVYQREWDTELSKIKHALQELELNLEQVNKQSKLSNTLDKEILENEKTLKELIKVQNKLSHLRQLYNEKVSEIEQINTKIENIYLNEVPKVRQLEKSLNNIVHKQDLDYLSIYELKEALKALEKYQDEYQTYIKDISDINNKLKQLLEERNAKYSEIYNIIDSVKKYNILEKKYLEDLDHIIYNLHEQLKENANYKENIVTLINESLSEYKIKMQQLEVFYKPSIEVTKLIESERARLNDICRNIDLSNFDIEKQLVFDSQHLQSLAFTHHISYETLVKWERQVLNETLKTIIKKLVIKQKTENERHIHELVELYKTIDVELQEEHRTEYVQQTLEINKQVVNAAQEKFERLALEVHNSKSDIYSEQLQEGIAQLQHKIVYFISEGEAFYNTLIEKKIEKYDLEFIKTVYQSQWSTKLSEIQYALQKLELHFDQLKKQRKLSTNEFNTLDYEISEKENLLREILKLQNKLSDYQKLYNQGFSEIKLINENIESVSQNELSQLKELEKLVKVINVDDLESLSLYKLTRTLKDLKIYQEAYGKFNKMLPEINEKWNKLVADRDTKIYQLNNIIESTNNLNAEKKKYLKDLDNFSYKLQEQIKENTDYEKSVTKLLNESLSEYKIKLQELEVFHNQGIEVANLLEAERARLNNISLNIDLSKFDIEKQLVFDREHLQSLALTYHIKYETLVNWERQVWDETLKREIKKLVIEQKTENERYIDALVELYKTMDALLQEQYNKDYAQNTLDTKEHGVNYIQENFESQLIEVRSSESSIFNYREEVQQSITHIKQKVELFDSENEGFYQSLITKKIEKHDLDFIKTIYEGQWSTKHEIVATYDLLKQIENQYSVSH